MSDGEGEAVRLLTVCRVQKMCISRRRVSGPSTLSPAKASRAQEIMARQHSKKQKRKSQEGELVAKRVRWIRPRYVSVSVSPIYVVFVTYKKSSDNRCREGVPLSTRAHRTVQASRGHKGKNVFHVISSCLFMIFAAIAGPGISGHDERETKREKEKEGSVNHT